MKMEAAVECIYGARRRGRLAQAYLVSGPPRGAGSRFAARVLQSLFCEGPDDGVPCNACRGCRAVEQHTHTDVLWVEPHKKSRQIAVEQVRALQQRVQRTSFEGGWRACVIVAADRLGREAANAFLKTLEEPGPRSVFLLLTDSPQFLLPTVVSRCQPISLDDESPALSEWDETLLEVLAAENPSGAVAVDAMARSTQLLALLKQLKDAAADEVAAETDEEAAEQGRDVMDARIGARYRELRAAFMRALLLWYRDRLMVTSDMATEVVYQDRVDAIRRQTAGLNRSTALRQVRQIEEMHDQLERNLPEALVFASGLARLNSV